MTGKDLTWDSSFRQSAKQRRQTYSDSNIAFTPKWTLGDHSLWKQFALYHLNLKANFKITSLGEKILYLRIHFYLTNCKLTAQVFFSIDEIKNFPASVFNKD